MVDFIKSVRKQGLMTDIIHAIFNIAFAGATIFLTIAFETPWPAIVLVLLSKWRVIAVRPRYWWANFLSSLPDLSIGIGIVVMSWYAGQIADGYLAKGYSLPVPALAVQVILGVLFAVWLVVVKPMHSEKAVAFQALASQFIGLTAIFTLGQFMPLVLAVALSYVVSFATARQVMGLYEEKDQSMVASIWGLLVMELAFVSWHWSVFYQLTPLVQIPQIALIVMVISVVAYRVYVAWNNDRQVTWEELGMPVVLTIVVTLLVLFGFSGLW